MLGAARLQNDASIVPYKLVAMFIADFKVSPRRDEGIPPYRMMADIDKYKTGESSNRAVFTYFKEFIFFKINGEICKYKTKKE